MNLLRNVLTEDRANQVWDPLRIGFVIGFFTIIGLEIYSVIVKGQAFDIQAAGIGIGTFLTATGLALFASSKQVES